MAHLTAFHYRPGDTLAHHLDVRIKFIVLIMMSLAVLKAPMVFLGLITIGQMLLIIRLRLPLKATLAEMRFLLFLLAAVFVARALSTPGIPLVALKWLTISKEGLRQAALIVWRMLLIVLLGLPFVVTTRPADIKAAVEWFLKPFPFLPAARIGTMIGLLLRFIPTIFAMAGETMAAQRARAVENRKNPIYRLTKFVPCKPEAIPKTARGRNFRSASGTGLHWQLQRVSVAWFLWLNSVSNPLHILI
jgi:energy-coupling factor transporter transmembrane protein EcfT